MAAGLSQACCCAFLECSSTLVNTIKLYSPRISSALTSTPALQFFHAAPREASLCSAWHEGEVPEWCEQSGSAFLCHGPPEPAVTEQQ